VTSLVTGDLLEQQVPASPVLRVGGGLCWSCRSVLPSHQVVSGGLAPAGVFARLARSRL